MRATRFVARNFRLLRDFELILSPDVTVLIGPNNSGKSNVVEAITVIAGSVRGNSVLDLLVRGFDRVVWANDRSLNIGFEVSCSSSWYSVDFSASGIETEQFRTEAFHAEGHRDYNGFVQWVPGGFTHLTAPFLSLGIPETDELKAWFRRVVNVEPFRRIREEMIVSPTLLTSPTGENIVQVLHYHYTSNRERFDQFEERIRRVLPEIDIVEAPLTTGTSATITVRFHADPQRYDLWQLSSGIKDVLVLVAAAHFSEPGSFVILEEPENHLHPAAQRSLGSVLLDLSATEEKQFLLTTHSETVLEFFGLERAVFLNKVNGESKAVKLADADLALAWEGLGIEPGKLLQAIGRSRHAIVIVEGRGDYFALVPLWEATGVADKVVTARSEGGGAADVARCARTLQEALRRFRIPTEVFVLLDNDGERDSKVAALAEEGFDNKNSHVWHEKELENYMFLPRALATIAGTDVQRASEAINGVSRRGKEGLDQIMKALGIADTGVGTIVRNALSCSADEIPREFWDVGNMVRALLSLPEMVDRN